MVRKYTLLSLRKIYRNLFVNVTNILGLAIGLSMSFITLLYLIHETGYDKHHKNFDRIYRIVENYHPEGSASLYKISYINDQSIQEIRQNHPDIESIANIYRLDNDYAIKHNNELVKADLCFTSASILEIFTFNLAIGDINDLLINSFDVLITETRKNQWFGNNHPIGETLTLVTAHDTLLLTIKGVVKDFPANSTFTFDIIGNVSDEYRKRHWYSFYSEESYVLAKPNISQSTIESKLPTYRHTDGAVMLTSYILQPLSDIYFKSGFITSYNKRVGNKKDVSLLSIFALFILLVSINNYVIFTVFDTRRAAKEIAIQKVSGASISNLKTQQVVSTLLHSGFSFIVSLFLLYAIIPYWNQYFEVNLFSLLFENVLGITSILGITLLAASISSLYTLFHIVKINPLLLFQTRSHAIKERLILQKTLIALQVILLVSVTSFSIIVWKQIRYATKKDHGFNIENRLYIDFSEPALKKHYHIIIQNLRGLPFVEDVAAINSRIPNDDFLKVHFPKFASQTENVILSAIVVDTSFWNTMGVELINYSKTSLNSIIINELAAKELEISSSAVMPINLVSKNGHTFTINGICKNFDYQTLNYNNSPLAIYQRASPLANIIVWFKPTIPKDAVLQIEEIFKNIVSDDFTFNAFHVNEYIESKYHKEWLFLKAIIIGSFIAIVIVLIGLLNISLLTIRLRTKEILFRKVVGASNLSILMLVFKDKLQLLLIGNIVSIPLSYLMISSWLKNYANFISITPLVYIIPLLISIFLLLIASLTSLSLGLRKSLISELNND